MQQPASLPDSVFAAKDFESADIRQLCDVVMKGGITSGVVYPLAICKLATSYVIKNIGGTSVGAIAAATAAAAEYRRRQSGSGQGYAELAKLPGFLGQKNALLALFAADPVARALLAVALIPIGNAPFPLKLLQLIATLCWQYLWIPVLSIAVVFAAFVAAAWPLQPGAIWRCLVAAVIFGTIAAFVGIAIRLIYRVVTTLDGNDFGWCHGFAADAEAKVSVTDVTQLSGKDVPPLFNWLDAFVAQTAGKPRSDPLTFGDLWSASQPSWHDAQGDRCIDFRMMTTCLTLGRPFELPFDPAEPIGLFDDPLTDTDNDGHKRPSIYFREADLLKFFPTAVVRQMVRAGQQTTLVTDDVYYRFPAADKVPIIVATRLSMSFPVLFCAVPLYALDVTGVMQQLWFSDGGLTSNFPIHFFDSPLPRWPTFAIDLLGGAPPAAKGPDEGSPHFAANAAALATYKSGTVFMESQLPRGTVNPWNRLDCGGARGNVLAFASAIVDAARTWQDVTLGTLPGNASRTVGIRLSASQGGLNLNMPPETIAAMVDLGLEAGDELVDVFNSGESDSQGWKDHRWIRYRAIMGAITRWVDGYKVGYEPFRERPAQASYEALIEDLPPTQRPAVLDATQRFASLPTEETFYAIEDPPIAVLPTRPVV